MLGPSLGTGSFQKLNSSRSWFLRDNSILPRSFLYSVNSYPEKDINQSKLLGWTPLEWNVKGSLPCSALACSSPLLMLGTHLCNATDELRNKTTSH